MPPSPNTRRARIGAILVRGVQRCLFWYTPQILQFHNDAANAFNSVCNLIDNQSERTTNLGRQVQKLRREMADRAGDLIRQQSEKIANLEEELKKLRQETTARLAADQSARTAAFEEEVQRLRQGVSIRKLDGVRTAAAPVEDGLPNSFQFALQDRFRGPEGETAAKLQVYVESLKPMIATLPGGLWLDLGCGRGEWLQAAAQQGYPVLGLDTNPASVLRCREKQLAAEQGDALAYLRSLGDRSAAVVTAFHVLEHWPMSYVLALVQEVVRILHPGGLFVVETPNPGNLLMGSANFWNDPTHRRPIPLKLLEFIYEHFGLTVVKRLEVNPIPKEQRFAYDELSVVSRLNALFYGPQDYGLIGRL